MRWFQPPGVRRVAIVVGACMVGLTAWALIVSGPDGLGIITFTGLIALASCAACRQQVTVQVGAITICNGVWTWNVRIEEVARVQWMTYRQAGSPEFLTARFPMAGNLYVVRRSGRPIAVPQTNVVDVEHPNRRSAAVAAWFSEATSIPAVAGHVDAPDESN